MAAKRKDKTSDLRQLRNIGRTIEGRLLEVGITNGRQLKKVGAAAAFKLIRKAHPKANLPACYYLYSLQGALLNMHWDDLPERTKRRLRRDAEKD